jgi:hypothetical protein
LSLPDGTDWDRAIAIFGLVIGLVNAIAAIIAVVQQRRRHDDETFQSRRLPRWLFIAVASATVVMLASAAVLAATLRSLGPATNRVIATIEVGDDPLFAGPVEVAADQGAAWAGLRQSVVMADEGGLTG